MARRIRGGGFRYDGLFRVASAEMVRSPTSGLLTAMFELRKVCGGEAEGAQAGGVSA